MKDGKNFFADSSFLIDLFEAEESALERLEKADRFISSVLCLYELDKYARFDRQKLERNNLVEVKKEDVNTAAEFYRELKDKGKMINQIDILIGAQAYNRGYKIVSRDDHFEKIEKLKVEIY